MRSDLQPVCHPLRRWNGILHHHTPLVGGGKLPGLPQEPQTHLAMAVSHFPFPEKNLIVKKIGRVIRL